MTSDNKPKEIDQWFKQSISFKTIKKNKTLAEFTE